ncbi:Uma2 family endonuclease [Ruegeria sp.]|uniref:Uma2 family endonuclease n=1 Tax=Ruegeria sp. TaxID=1879320 RepID=UPI003B00D482
MAKTATVTAKNKHPATYQDVIDAPSNMVAQILGGTLHTHPRPAFPHAVAASSIGGKLMDPFNHGTGGPGGWWILDEPEVHLGDDVVVPDLAGWRREIMPDPPETPFVSIAPNWVCEVLSPSTRQIDLGPKRAIYARDGVGHLWLVDPDGRTLEAFELKDGQWVLIASLANADTVSVPPFDAISFALSNLWP